MKVQLLSDLHLEANPQAQFSPAPGAELLVLAGDIGSYQDRTQGPPLAEPDWGLQRFSPLPQYAGWPVPVLFVPGNHEYDGRDWDETHRALRATCERLGLIWLEREVWTHRGGRFVGTTLWSDYDALPQHPRDKLYRAANFHLQKMATQRHGALFDAAAMRELALECGYNAASIRERIYADVSSPNPQAGILIYTAAADSDGTLGGLVDLGKPENLGRLLRQALNRSKVCSSDPLCSEHDPAKDRSLHAAACHACSLVAETSCERGNRYLDRSLLVQTLDRGDAAFFAGL